LTYINPTAAPRKNDASSSSPESGAEMNYSIATADRATHLRIVAVALFWAIAVMAIVITVR
jgi:hypothetical protein